MKPNSLLVGIFCLIIAQLSAFAADDVNLVLRDSGGGISIKVEKALMGHIHCGPELVRPEPGKSCFKDNEEGFDSNLHFCWESINRCVRMDALFSRMGRRGREPFDKDFVRRTAIQSCDGDVISREDFKFDNGEYGYAVLCKRRKLSSGDETDGVLFLFAADFANARLAEFDLYEFAADFEKQNKGIQPGKEPKILAVKNWTVIDRMKAILAKMNRVEPLKEAPARKK